MPKITSLMDFLVAVESLYRDLNTMAETGEEFPGVLAMSDRMGVTLHEMYKRLRALQKSGRVIVFTRAKNKMVIEIVETGKRTAAPLPPPPFWTEEKTQELIAIMGQNPRPFYREIARMIGCSKSAVECKAYELGLTRPMVPKDAVLPIAPPVGIPDRRDPLLARLVEAFGREPWKGPIHRPGVTLPVIPIRATHIGREAPC